MMGIPSQVRPGGGQPIQTGSGRPALATARQALSQAAGTTSPRRSGALRHAIRKTRSAQPTGSNPSTTINQVGSNAKGAQRPANSTTTQGDTVSGRDTYPDHLRPGP